MDFKRSDRLADLLQREIAELLYRGLKDPRLGGVTITGADVSADLRHARVYYFCRGDEDDKEKAAHGLAKAKGFIRRELGKRLHLKYTPELDFRFDTSFEYGAKIDRLLEEIKRDE